MTIIPEVMGQSGLVIPKGTSVFVKNSVKIECIQYQMSHEHVMNVTQVTQGMNERGRDHQL